MRAIAPSGHATLSPARYLGEQSTAARTRVARSSISISRMATVAASLPLRAAARAGPAPSRLLPSDAAFFPGRPWQRGLAARARPREPAGWFRAEALSGGGGGGPPRREPMAPPYNVLITGSTKGIGYALARKFLKAGDNVVICSRSAERVESVANDLKKEFGEQHVWGTVCDVREGACRFCARQAGVY